MAVQPQIDRDSFRATASGFTCRCGGMPRTFSDDEVQGLTVRRKRTVAADGTARTHECLSIRVADVTFPPVEVDIQYTGPDDKFLAPFLDRLLANLTERALASVSRNEPFDGGLWIIDHESLTDKQSTSPLALETISGIGWHEGHFCVWLDGSDQPVLSFAADQENTYLLARLLSHLLHIDESQIAVPDVEPGRGMYEFHDKGFMAQIALGTAGAACVLIAVSGWLAVVAGQAENIVELVLAAVTLVVAGMVYWRSSSPSVLRLSENALSIVSRGREALVPLADLAQFSADWTDFRRRGVYQQTLVRFQFHNGDATAPTLKHHSLAVRGRPKYAELQGFQAQLAEIVARRLRDELESSGRARWTARLVIVDGGIEFTKKASGQPQLIEFSRVTNWQLDRGVFKLALDWRRRPEIVEQANQWNFYPGLALFTQLLESSRSKSVLPVEA
jgi:hypothetical protein